MPNFNPKTENLILFRPTGKVEGKLSRKPIQFVVEQLMTLPSKQQILLLRKWVQDGARGLMEKQASISVEASEPAESPKVATKKRRR